MAGLSGNVKKIIDLVTGTPADDDCFVFGKSDLKKITLVKLKDTLGITSLNSALAEETKRFTYKGLSISAIKKSGILRIKITGSANDALGTNNNYVTIATLPAGFAPQGGSFKFINFYTEKNCQLQILSSGSVQLGYSRNNGSPEDITSGDSVRIDESFVI